MVSGVPPKPKLNDKSLKNGNEEGNFKQWLSGANVISNFTNLSAKRVG